MLKTWQEELFTADATSSKRVFQPFKCNRNCVVNRIRIGLVGIGNPTFSDVYAEIYAYDSVKKIPTKLLYTSTNQVNKTDLTTEDNFAKEIPIDFNSVALNGDTYYAIIIRAHGYTYSYNSYLGWRKDFPDPAYKINNSANSMSSVGTVSYWIRFIGDEF